MKASEANGVRPAGGVNPYSLRNTLVHPLARMLPLQRWQQQVYRLGEKNPPAGDMQDHAPSWEVASFVLPALGTIQARINVQKDFHLLAITTTSSVQTALGGFRAQLYDAIKKVRFADRGMLRALMGGTTSGPFFLREPYQFDQPNSQILVMVQNMELVQNTIQLSLYGQVLRFNQ